MKEQMDVGIDQAGHERPVPEIDDLDVGWTLDRRSHFDNVVALNKNFSRLDDLAGFNVEQPGSMKKDRMRCGGSGLRGRGPAWQETPYNDENKDSVAHMARKGITPNSLQTRGTGNPQL